MTLSDLGQAIIEGSFKQLWRKAESRDQKLAVSFAHFLLSRRARGKALDRIVIDITHVIRKREKEKAKQQPEKRGKKKKGKQPASAVPDFIAAFTREALDGFAQSATVSFSSIRTLARRLKQPLYKSLEASPSCEAQELGLRLGQEPVRVADRTKYSDFVPVTDHAVANSMAVEETMVGRRCSFVGHEDDPAKANFSGSLNVEQLAMEFYASGRLPEGEQTEGCSKGGWVGWHGEYSALPEVKSNWCLANKFLLLNDIKTRAAW